VNPQFVAEIAGSIVPEPLVRMSVRVYATEQLRDIPWREIWNRLSRSQSGAAHER
jgi:hypothetical protein